MSLVTPSSTPIASTLTASATADATAPATPAPSQGGFWNDLKNLPGQALGAVEKVPVIGKAIGTAMSWANKPLQEIQKDYKFVHSLYTDHGWAAGLVGTLGVVGGGVIGTLTGIPGGTVLGADLAGAAERQILGRVVPSFRDSFNKSNDPNYLVSAGRDLAHGLSYIPGLGALANTNSGVGQIVSGVADASFDFETDPLANLGKLSSQLRRGDHIALVKEIDFATGEIVRDEKGMPVNKIDPTTGKVIPKNTLPFASSAGGMSNFTAGVAVKKIFSPEQYDAAMANPLNGAQRAARQDIVSIAQNQAMSDSDKAGLIWYKYGKANQWSQATIRAMVKINDTNGFDQVAKQTLYSADLADRSEHALTAFSLPSRTVGKRLSEKIGLDAIRNSKNATNYNESLNLLLPRKSAVMEPVLNPDGTQALDESGQPAQRFKTRSVTNAQTGEVTQEQVFKLNKPALFYAPGRGAMINALANKVRTFTGEKPLSYDTDANSLSSHVFDVKDPGFAKTTYDTALLSMPHNIALERAGAMIMQTNNDLRVSNMHVLNQEVLKNLGVADSQSAHLFSDLHDASAPSNYDPSVYAVNQGRDVGSVDMLPEHGGGQRPLAITYSQRYQGALLDLKKTRTALREAKAYGALYSPVDDFFTKYTNVIFAPLALLSPAFGIRVSTGEVLQQVMRRGLVSYLGQRLAASTLNLSEKYQNFHIDKMDDALTQTDKNAKEAELATGKSVPVKSNEITKELDERMSTLDKLNKLTDSKQGINNAIVGLQDKRYRVMPFSYMATRFKESNLGSYLVDDKIKYMIERAEETGTYLPTPAVSAAHNASQELTADDHVDIFHKQKGYGTVPGEEIQGLTSTDHTYDKYWAKNINNAAADFGQRDIARALINARKNPEFAALPLNEQFARLVDGQAANLRNPNMYKEYRGIMDGYTKAVPESFAKAQIDNLQGLVHGADNTINMDIVNRIAKSETISEKELKQLPQMSKPIKVLGRYEMPTISKALQRVEQMGYSKFVTPVMDWISRQPLYNDFYMRARQNNQALLDMGLMDRSEVVRLSQMQATRDMIPAIHSPAIRSQWATMHRSLLPFYFAQEQAMRRTGRLILSNPQAFRDFQIIQQGLNNPGFVHTDANGQKYIVYPGLGEAGNAIMRGLNAIGLKQFTGLPSSISGNTSSLLSVLPEIKPPGISPFLNFALTDLSKKFPWTDKAVNLANGGYPSQNFIDTFMPSSTMRDLWNSMSMDDRESTVYNSKLSAIMAAYYHGDLPTNFTSLPAFQQQQILTKIEHNAQTNLIIKGLFAFFLPLAPTVSNDYYDKNMQTLRSEYLGLLNQTDPTTGAKYTAPAALNKFIADNGERALSYTVARTTSGTSGAYAPLADSTVTWINNNQPILNNPNYSTAAPYLIPQVADSKDALAVENKLLINHFRAKVTSKDFISALYVKQGWQDLSADYTAYQSDMNNLRASGDKQGMYQASQIWKQITADYGQSNPIWYADYNNPTKVEMAQKAITQFTAMQDKGILAVSPQGKKISEILDNYKQYHADLLANTYNGKHLPGYSAAQDAWYSYMDNLAASDPQLASVVTGVFRRAV